jgi:hypothetical protein
MQRKPSPKPHPHNPPQLAHPLKQPPNPPPQRRRHLCGRQLCHFRDHPTIIHLSFGCAGETKHGGKEGVHEDVFELEFGAGAWWGEVFEGDAETVKEACWEVGLEVY